MLQRDFLSFEAGSIVQKITALLQQDEEHKLQEISRRPT